MKHIKDTYNVVRRYEKAKIDLEKDMSIVNRKLISKLLANKEEELSAVSGHENNIRYCKTLLKYINMFKQVDKWFNKDFHDITENDLKELWEKLEKGLICSRNGKPYSANTKRDYYVKIFKSDFFEQIGKKQIAEAIFKRKMKKRVPIRYFYIEDLKKMLRYITKDERKLLLWLLFDTGMRIGTLLNMKHGDFEKKHDDMTNMDYYIYHIRSDYTKSQSDLTDMIISDEANSLLDELLDKSFPEKYLFDISHSGALNTIKRASLKANVKVKPIDETPNIHDFRRSMCLWLGEKGYQADYVKRRLNHKPSSTMVDQYFEYAGIRIKPVVQENNISKYNDLLVAYKQATEKIKMLENNQRIFEEQLNKKFKLIELWEQKNK
jgi:site-specific recombinase XerD